MPYQNLKTIMCTTCGARLEIMPEGDVGVCPACGNTYIVSLAEKLNEKSDEEVSELSNLRALLSEAVKKNDISGIAANAAAIRTLIPDDYSATYYFCYAANAKGKHEYIAGFYAQKPELYTEDEAHAIADHICEYSDLRDRSMIEKYFMFFDDPEYGEKYRAAYNERKKTEEYYDDVPRDIFVCHRSTDVEIVKKAVDALERDSHTCWVSYRNLRPNDSDNYHKNIEKAIRSCALFLVVTSEDAMVSKDVKSEMSVAKAQNKPRLEYKIDDADHTTFFKDFFDGIQWVDGYTADNKGISRLCQRVYLELESIKNADKKPDFADAATAELKSLRELLEKAQAEAGPSRAEPSKKENLFKLIRIAICDEGNFANARKFLDEVKLIDAEDYRCWWYGLLLEYRVTNETELCDEIDFVDSNNYKLFSKYAETTEAGRKFLGSVNDLHHEYLRSLAIPLEQEAYALSTDTDIDVDKIKALERTLKTLHPRVRAAIDMTGVNNAISSAYESYYRRQAAEFNDKLNAIAASDYVFESDIDELQRDRFALDKNAVPFIAFDYDDKMEDIFEKCYSRYAADYNLALKRTVDKERVTESDIEELHRIRQTLSENARKYIDPDEQEIIDWLYKKSYANQAEKLNRDISELKGNPDQPIEKIERFEQLLKSQPKQVKDALSSDAEGVIKHAFDIAYKKQAREIKAALATIKRKHFPSDAEVSALEKLIEQNKNRPKVMEKLPKNYADTLKAARKSADERIRAYQIKQYSKGHGIGVFFTLVAILAYSFSTIYFTYSAPDSGAAIAIHLAAILFAGILRNGAKNTKVKLISPAAQRLSIYSAWALTLAAGIIQLIISPKFSTSAMIALIAFGVEYLILSLISAKCTRNAFEFGNFGYKSTWRTVQAFAHYALAYSIWLFTYVSSANNIFWLLIVNAVISLVYFIVTTSDLVRFKKTTISKNVYHNRVTFLTTNKKKKK